MSAKTRRLVYDRDAGCVRCGTTQGLTVHHRLPRGRGGPDSPDNLLSACGSGTTGCHGWIESHRAEAYISGWLVRTGFAPSHVGVRYTDGVWWLGADGSRLRVGEAA